jgi:hypothetical protein
VPGAVGISQLTFVKSSASAKPLLLNFSLPTLRIVAQELPELQFFFDFPSLPTDSVSQPTWLQAAWVKSYNKSSLPEEAKWYISEIVL